MKPTLHKRAGLLARLHNLLHEDLGQSLVLIAVGLTLVLGTAALAIDTGHARYLFRELQATTDSSALAAARAMPTLTTSTQVTGIGATQTSFSSVNANGVAAEYGAVTGGVNQRSSLPSVSMVTTLKCLTTVKNAGIPCIGNIPYNAVQVTQTSVIPNYFAGVLGHRTMTISTTSTAAIRGGSPRPSNIAVIIDTTLSMLTIDTNCIVAGVAVSQMQCALNGFQVLLKSINPCGNNQATCNGTTNSNTNPFDQVALFTFPALSSSTAPQNYNCTTAVPNYDTYDAAILSYIVFPPNSAYSGIATAQPYQLPSAGSATYAPTDGTTYQVTPFLSDYRLSNTATTLNVNSNLTKAAGAVSGCGGMAPSSFDGIYGTYYAGVLYAAQSALVQQQVSNPGSENVIILLSDGDSTAGGQQIEGTPPNLYGANNGNYNVFPSPASSGGSYPSWYGQCGQAIVAAQAAASAGTLVYSVGYGAEPLGCYSDVNQGSHPNINPCDTMYDIASAPQMFYSDYQQSGSNSVCYSSQPVTSLAQIFAAIASDLTEARLLPNNAT